MLTALEELKGHERAAGANRPRGTLHGESRGQANWLDECQAAREFADSDPTVLVVGAGQGELALSARLGQLGVAAPTAPSANCTRATSCWPPG
ncbi:hypothetical protein [Pseudonocardia sp. H11422]|uniref:hypothetical protein n=1 Tax=Pseudonocardia sp. H11422 TaxID=2835866 RepID=UPI001BDD4210|nr:hypothetical protein [Pseudonocardia sp. H11422]